MEHATSGVASSTGKTSNTTGDQNNLLSKVYISLSVAFLRFELLFFANLSLSLNISAALTLCLNAHFTLFLLYSFCFSIKIINSAL